MFVRMIFLESQNILLPNLVWWCSIMSLSVMQKASFFSFYHLQGQGYSKSSYDQNMTLSAIFSELLIPWQPNLVWWYIIRSQNVLWKTGLLHSGSRSQRRVKMLMIVQMLSSKPPNILFPKLVLWCIILNRSVMQNIFYFIFKVNVTARALMITLWQFLLYLLNCSSFFIPNLIW